MTVWCLRICDIDDQEATTTIWSTYLDACKAYCCEIVNHYERFLPNNIDLDIAAKVNAILDSGDYEKIVDVWANSDQCDLYLDIYEDGANTFSFAIGRIPMPVSALVVAEESTVACDDYTCTVCGNTRISSKTETSCWKCGTNVK